MWSDDRSFLSDFGKFYTESKAKLYDWISDFVGIMRSGKLVSHASVWRKMHGDRWDYHDCYSTIPKYVDTYCTYSRPLHFTGNLFLSVLPQDNFIIMLFHFTFNQRVICPLIFSSFIQRNYRWQVVYILFMQCKYIKYANIIFYPDTEMVAKNIRDELYKLNIIPIGRFGEWKYFWSDQAFLSGYQAASKENTLNEK